MVIVWLPDDAVVVAVDLVSFCEISACCAVGTVRACLTLGATGFGRRSGNVREGSTALIEEAIILGSRFKLSGLILIPAVLFLSHPPKNFTDVVYRNIAPLLHLPRRHRLVRSPPSA